MPGTAQGQAFLFLLVPACHCLSLSVHHCPCFSLSVPVCSCLSLFSPTWPSGPSWCSSRNVCLFRYLFVCLMSPFHVIVPGEQSLGGGAKKKKQINHSTSSNLYRFYYPHQSRELVSPVSGIFPFLSMNVTTFAIPQCLPLQKNIKVFIIMNIVTLNFLVKATALCRSPFIKSDPKNLSYLFQNIQFFFVFYFLS